MKSPFWLPLCLTMSMGCDSTGSRAAALALRDSAGVQIVENAGTTDLPARNWTIGVRPTLVIGSANGDAAELFTRIGGVTRLSDGTIAVLESGTSEVRFFYLDGRHKATVGGNGDGPGEFRRAVSLVRAEGDSLLVHDAGTAALTILAPDGAFVRKLNSDIAGLYSQFEVAHRCPVLPILHDGTVLGCAVAPGFSDPVQVTHGFHFREGFRLVRLHYDTARVDMLGVFVGTEGHVVNLGGRHAVARHPFFSDSHVAVGQSPNVVYLANNPAYEIEVWDPEGNLVRIIRRMNAQLDASEELQADAWELLTEQLEQDVGRIASGFPVPDSVPAVLGLTAGPSGELWVKRESVLGSANGALFDVFDSEGTYIGDVKLPFNVELEEVAESYVLAVYKDAVGVPYIHVYNLDRSGA